MTPLRIDNEEALYYFSDALAGQQFLFVVTLANENGLWEVRDS